jgi:excisionase family DNA binding protein
MNANNPQVGLRSGESSAIVASEYSEVSDGAFDVKAAADFCSLSLRTIRYALANGELESFRFGKKVLIAKSHLVAWLAAMLAKSREAKNSVR